MKKILLGTLLTLLMASTAFAQYPPSGATVGVYFDDMGTTAVSYTFQPGQTKTCYVVIFWENMVGGCSFKTIIDPTIAVVAWDFSNGVALGLPWDGCGMSFGFYDAQFGFMGTPVVVGDFTILNTNAVPYETSISVVPHCYEWNVVVSDRFGGLFTADGLCAVIPTESNSWGSVKELYR
jgi:hypothetical protein